MHHGFVYHFFGICNLFNVYLQYESFRACLLQYLITVEVYVTPSLGTIEMDNKVRCISHCEQGTRHETSFLPKLIMTTIVWCSSPYLRHSLELNCKWNLLLNCCVDGVIHLKIGFASFCYRLEKVSKYNRHINLKLFISTIFRLTYVYKKIFFMNSSYCNIPLLCFHERFVHIFRHYFHKREIRVF